MAFISNLQVGGRSVVNSDIMQLVEIREEDDRFLRLLEVRHRSGPRHCAPLHAHQD